MKFEDEPEDQDVDVEVEDTDTETNEAETNEAEEETVAPDNRIGVRLPYKKCFSCAYLMDWQEDLYSCFGKPQCPAQHYKILRGMDPMVYIENKAQELAALQGECEMEAYMDLLTEIRGRKPDLLKAIVARTTELVFANSKNAELAGAINTVI